MQNLSLLIILLLLNSISFAASDNYKFEQEEEAKRFENLIKDFRCVTCQNQNLADSSAPIAESMRDSIFNQMQNGKSDKDIENFLVERYGEFVLYNPRFKLETWVLWLGPFILLGVAVMIAKKCFVNVKD